MRFVLASASPARLDTLRRAGFDPEVLVSGVDESGVDLGPAATALELARRKADAVAARLSPEALVLGCDSVLEFAGATLGKPRDADDARARWRSMRGGSGVLHTGHALRHLGTAGSAGIERVASTTVHFADVTDAEIDAYVDTHEPLAVAGAFTVDGLGGPFITAIEGDFHNVVGVSLPLLRELLAALGFSVPELWAPRS